MADEEAQAQTISGQNHRLAWLLSAWLSLVGGAPGLSCALMTNCVDAIKAYLGRSRLRTLAR